MKTAFPFEIVELKDGVRSLRSLVNKETFHPAIGPMAEANILHIEQQNIAERCQESGNFVVWDVGLGAAANAIACIEALASPKARVEIHSFDLSTEPLQFALAHSDALDYVKAHRNACHHLLEKGFAIIHDKLRWYFHRGDFRNSMQKSDIPKPQAIFYDPYSPRCNSEMWSLEHFRSLEQRIRQDRPYLLSNYTRSTPVRVTWLLAGFYVGIGTKIAAKEETSLASNELGILPQPLLPSWLKRVRISPKSAPYRIGDLAGPIQSSDWEELLHHSQFSMP